MKIDWVETEPSRYLQIVLATILRVRASVHPLWLRQASEVQVGSRAVVLQYGTVGSRAVVQCVSFSLLPDALCFSLHPVARMQLVRR